MRNPAHKQAQNNLDILQMKLDLEEKHIAAAFNKLLSEEGAQCRLLWWVSWLQFQVLLKLV